MVYYYYSYTYNGSSGTRRTGGVRCRCSQGSSLEFELGDSTTFDQSRRLIQRHSAGFTFTRALAVQYSSLVTILPRFYGSSCASNGKDAHALLYSSLA
eukprot:5449262-Pyramimonas_sp.AAC.1